MLEMTIGYLIFLQLQPSSAPAQSPSGNFDDTLLFQEKKSTRPGPQHQSGLTSLRVLQDETTHCCQLGLGAGQNSGRDLAGPIAHS